MMTNNEPIQNERTRWESEACDGGKSILSQWPQSIKLRNCPCNFVRFVKDETFPTQIKMLIINAASLQPLSSKSSWTEYHRYW